MKQAANLIVRAPIVAIMIIQVAALFARAFLETRLIDSGEPKPYAQDLSYLVVPPILIVLMWPILRQHGQFLLSLLRRQQLTLRLILISVALGITLRMTYWGGLISLISFGVLQNSAPRTLQGPVISFGCPDPAVLALSFVVAALLIPITEEIINRGLILQSLLHRGKILALALSSVLFTVVHDPQSIAFVFLVGLLLGAQMINCKTLWAPIITHATYNALTVLDWECVSAQWNPTETTTSMVATGLIAAVSTLAAVSASIFLSIRKGRGDA